MTAILGIPTSDEYKKEIFNKYVRKRMRKLLYKKLFLMITLPIWCLPWAFCFLGKEIWRDISHLVEKRNPGPTKEE